MEFSERVTQTTKGKIFSRTTPKPNNSQPPLILIPGMIVSGRYMIPLACELADEFETHIIDLPGFGRSEKIQRYLSIQEIADGVDEWMSGNFIKRANFAANSFGCQILADFASRYTTKPLRLILQGPTVDKAARSILKQLIRLKRNSLRERKSVGTISIKDYWAAGFLRDIQTIRLTISDQIEEKLPLIEAPTLIVRGNEDVVVPQAWAEEVANLLPHGKLITVANAAHSMNYSEPAKLAKVIKSFLKENPGA